MSTEGHNSDTYRATAAELRGFIERHEHLDEERKEIVEQMKDIVREAKAMGYDTKALAEVLRRRKRDREAVSELDEIIRLYEETLGVFG